jgi:parvulin-like peptidyl-prolyl isomerase
MQKQLHGIIDIKLLYADARRKIPAENFPKIEESLSKRFEEHQLPKLLASTQSSSRAELEGKLLEMDSSIEQQKRSFIEMVIAYQWREQTVRDEEEITHEELWAHYEQNLADYEHKAKARWEELVARFDRFPTRNDAQIAIAQWGNEVKVKGRPLAEVARQVSHGVTAEEGGQHDWTTQGSLVSSVVDQAIFTLPLGQLSQILIDTDSYRIVRVMERKEAGRVPFDKAQAEIREQIKKTRRTEKMDQFVARLRDTTPVWTIFDAEEPAQVVQQPDGDGPTR